MTNTQQVEPFTVHHPRRAAHARPRPSVASVLVGVFGELLITAGVLVGLLVVWQVYYTDVIGLREAHQHIAEFEAGAVAVTEPEKIAEAQYGPAPAESGDGRFAVLYVPRWGEEYQMPIASGTSLDIINDGAVGHYEETQLPGEIGNFALAGHRQTNGKPFRYVEELRPGDPIIVRTKEHFYVYRVKSDRIVRPDQVEVLAANPYDPGSPPEVATITFTTCHPLWTVRERWITHADLEYWTYVDDGRPADLPRGSL